MINRGAGVPDQVSIRGPLGWREKPPSAHLQTISDSMRWIWVNKLGIRPFVNNLMGR